MTTTAAEHLTWRPLAPSDDAAMADLLNAVDAEDHVWGRYTVQDAAEELAAPTVDLGTSTLAVFDGPTMLGFSAVHDRPEADGVHRMQAAGAVSPTHRRQGLGTTLLRHALETARTLHAQHHPTSQLVVDSLYSEHVDGAVALYRAAGMTATERNLHMRHPLGAATPVAPVPDGLRLEGWTAGTDEEFRAVRNDAFATDGSAPLGTADWKTYTEDANFRPELSFLLRDDRTGTAAGLVLTLCWEAETAATGIRDAYLAVIGTRAAYRKRGVAHALISHTLRVAADQGYGRASLRVTADSTSGGFGFAERAGFVVQDTQVRYCLEP